MKGFHHIYDSPLGSSNPVGKIHVVGYGCTEHDESNMFGKHNDGFFPDDSSFRVVDIVNLIKDDPLYIFDHV